MPVPLFISAVRDERNRRWKISCCSPAGMPMPSSETRISIELPTRRMEHPIVASSFEYLHALEMRLLKTDSIFTTSHSAVRGSLSAVKTKCTEGHASA